LRSNSLAPTTEALSENREHLAALSYLTSHAQMAHEATENPCSGKLLSMASLNLKGLFGSSSVLANFNAWRHFYLGQGHLIAESLETLARVA
jgi:hypothetical protein